MPVHASPEEAGDVEAQVEIVESRRNNGSLEGPTLSSFGATKRQWGSDAAILVLSEDGSSRVDERLWQCEEEKNAGAGV
jgi:hypothetical protein